MKPLRAVLYAGLPVVVACVVQAQSADANLSLHLDATLAVQAAAAPSQPPLTREEVEHIALAENPEVHVAGRRLAMAEAHVPTTGKLDDPQLMYRGWQVPLSKPWNYNDAQNMFMFAQSLQGPGKRDLQTNIAKTDVDQAKAELEMTRLRIRIEARKAFNDLLLAEDELRIHDQHVGIAHQAVEAARIKYSVGKVPQRDILKAQLALTRLAEHMIHFTRDTEVARAHLNTLLGRNPAAPLVVQGNLAVPGPLPSGAEVEQIALQARPDLLAARVAIEKSRREQELAKKAYTPDFSLAGGYMLMPSGQSPRNNYMIEGSMTLPWLNRHKHDAEIAEAGAKVSEQEAEAAAVRSAAFSQISEALAEARAAQELAHVYQESLKPQAEGALHASVIAYENNQADLLDLLDSQMAVIDIDLGWRQAVSDLAARMADLEMAAGDAIDLARPVTGEERQ